MAGKNTFNIEEGINQIKKLVDQLKEKSTIVIGVSGASCAGKGYVSKIISEKINGNILSMDDYYLGIEFVKDKNFDVPQALDLKLLKKHTLALKQNKKIKKPIYDFTIHQRVGYEEYKPSKIIIIEGLFALSNLLRKKN